MGMPLVDNRKPGGLGKLDTPSRFATLGML